MGRIITVAAMKGGTGKTMMVCSLAGVLAENHKVLIIDCDPQSNATSNLGYEYQQLMSAKQSTVCSIFGKVQRSPEDLVIKGFIEKLPNLDLIPGSIYLTGDEFDLISAADRTRTLYYYLEDYKAFYDQYDYIFIDTNPSFGIINQNCYYVADSIVLTTDVSRNGIASLEIFQMLWLKICRELHRDFDDLRVDALIVNNCDMRSKFVRDIERYCNSSEWVEGLLVSPVIPMRMTYKDTETFKLPINVYKPNSEETKLIRELVSSLTERGVF